MEHANYASRLRYLDADDVEDSTVDIGRLGVIGNDNARLGTIDGFIMDAAAGRIYHLVVDSGGWFTSRRFLLPIGHATVDREAGAVRVDVGQEALRHYPEFDPDRFRQFSDADLREFDRRTQDACCPDEPIADVSATESWQYGTQRHFSQPGWWKAGYAQDRLRPLEASAHRDTPARELHDRELVTARERDRGDITRRTDEDSPHFEGRAQPGDVLGLETGGERTYIGETAEDENKRRRDAEEAARDAETDLEK